MSADNERRNMEMNFLSVMKQNCPHTKRSTAGCIGLKYTAEGLSNTTSKKNIVVSDGLKTLFTLLVLMAIRLTTMATMDNTPHTPLSSPLWPKSQTSPLPASGIRKEVTASPAIRQESTFVQNEYFPRTVSLYSSKDPIQYLFCSICPHTQSWQSQHRLSPSVSQYPHHSQ